MTVRLPVDRTTPVDEVVAAVREWIGHAVPAAWREAAARGGAAAIREVRARADYEAWYPAFADAGLVVPTWPVDYGGLDLPPATARAIEQELRPYNLGRLNPLGLNLAAPALFAHGSEEQRQRFLPPIVRNDEVWCQLFSEPGAGSDLASLATRATRAERDGDGGDWVVTGQKVWTTWAHLADFGVLLARTDPDVPKRKGITYFLVDLRAPGVEVRPLRHIGGEVDFNEVFLDHVRVPDDRRVGEVGAGWTVANATLSGERQMVAGSGSGGVDRIGGSGVGRLLQAPARTVPAGRAAHAAAGGGDDRAHQPATSPGAPAGRAASGPTSGRRARIGSAAGAVDGRTAEAGTGAEPVGHAAVVAGASAGGASDDRAAVGGGGVASHHPHPVVRQRLMRLYSEERIRGWTNQRVRAGLKVGRPPGPESSIGKVHGGELNQRIQLLATDLLGPGAMAWEAPLGTSGKGYAESLPYELAGMLRSRANTIEGGTTEVNKNIVAERVLGLPREPDPWRDAAWREVPRS